MKIKTKYSLTNNRTIWRLIPSGDKLLIEERDPDSREVYFQCIEIESGRILLKDFQLDEKFWIGVEAFENDNIYFHRFVKPDMPGHIGITAFDLIAKSILWSRPDPVFLFLYEDRIYAFLQKFESRQFFSIDAQTGEIIKDYDENAQEIDRVREKFLDRQYETFKNYFYPEPYYAGKPSSEIQSRIEDLKQEQVVSGTVDFVNFNNLLLLNFHTVIDNGKLNNKFRVIEIDSGKIIFEDVLNTGITSYIPESFFIRDNLLFLIKDKVELMVFPLI
jgi:hypothetical protein